MKKLISYIQNNNIKKVLLFIPNKLLAPISSLISTFL